MKISLFMLIFVLVLMVVPLVVGTYVYQDSRKRGMNPLVWTLVSLLVPALIGFVIYLLARVGYADETCPRCQTPVKETYVVCPNCGVKLKPTCPYCDQSVEPGWKVCPYCAKALPERQDDVVEPVRRKDKSLKVILGAIVAMPIAIVLMLVAHLIGGDIRGSMNTTYWQVEQYLEEKQDPTIEAWIRQCEEKAAQDKELKAYVLRHDTEHKGERLTQFLVYLPVAEGNLQIQADRYGTALGAVLQVRFLTTAEDPENPETVGYRLCTVSCRTDKIRRIEVFRNVTKLDCEVTKVDYNLTLFEMVPQ